MSLFRDTRHKQELALAEHVKKAVNAVETAPKQKHVRKCILFLLGVPDVGALLGMPEDAAGDERPNSVLQGLDNYPQIAGWGTACHPVRGIE